MAASRHPSTTFFPPTGTFDLNFLMREFKRKLEEHSQRIGATLDEKIGFEVKQPDNNYNFQHYQIWLGGCCLLTLFFHDHKIGTSYSVDGSYSIIINKNELDNAGLTYRHAHKFLYDLTTWIENRENQLNVRTHRAL